jgi:mannitol/fructose-specific phosphotransferase system IIA component (Ntr-type)
MQLASLTEPGLIFPSLRSTDVPSLLRLLASRIVEQAPLDDSTALYEKLWEREQLGTTAIGSGVAIPHCKTDGLDRVFLAIGLLDEGIDFGAMDGQPVRVVFCIVSPAQSPAAHLQCLAAISKWVKGERHVEQLLDSRDPVAIFDLLREDSE